MGTGAAIASVTTTPAPDRDDEPRRGLWTFLARLVVALRWLIVPVWIIGALAALHFLPSFSSVPGGSSDILSSNTAPLAAEVDSVKDFGFPLLPNAAMVQYRPGGLSPRTQTDAISLAERIDAGKVHVPGLLAAVPLLDTGHVLPTARGPLKGTTAVTWLLFGPSESITGADNGINHLAHRYLSSPAAGYQGATGLVPAEAVQANLVGSHLGLVELAAIIVVFLIVGLGFRSVVAPLITLLAVGVAYAVSVRVLAVAALNLHFGLPGQLEPLIVILVVGIVTDYAVFFMWEQRDHLADGLPPRRAAVRAAAQVIPLVLVAGMTVAAGTATLSLAHLNLYGELGPGMAIAAFVGVIVAVTFVPAAMAIAGRILPWPFDHPRRQRRLDIVTHRRERRQRVYRFGTGRIVSAALLLVSLAGLAAAASPLQHFRLGLNLATDLPASSGPHRAETAAAHGFAAGITSPTVVLVTGHDLSTPRLAELGREMAAVPHIAGEVGPGNVPHVARLGLFVNHAHTAARYLLILDQLPEGAPAIATLEHLQRELPSMVHTAGLGGATARVTGLTAVAASLSEQTSSSVALVVGAILGVDLLMLILLLRCLVAPVLLLCCSVLTVLASLGLTALVFEGTGQGLTFYVPMAVGVLLISFGSDYNIFLVGRIWEEARRGTLRDAILAAVPNAASTITRAGTALALTFVLLALVPIGAFVAFAFGMVVGILIDTFVVRTLMVPSVLSLLGRFSAWPNRSLARRLAASGDGTAAEEAPVPGALRRGA